MTGGQKFLLGAFCASIVTGAIARNRVAKAFGQEIKKLKEKEEPKSE